MSRNEKGRLGLTNMAPTEVERPLQPEALEEIERFLQSKLKRRRLSDSFIERAGKDAIQRALVEYLEALESGREIEDPGAFLRETAYWRAIDELRREERQAGAVAVEALLEDERFAEPTTEELAIEDLATEELRQALTEMSAEERQVLVLHYFEERSYLQSAQLLYLSERSYRRRLAKALSHLGRLLGAPAPEVGSHQAIEVGLLAWVSLRGARVVIAGGPLEPLAGALDRAREALHLLFERRPRDLAATLSADGTSERIGAIASGPAGKIVGGCAAAAIVCVLGVFVVVPHHHAVTSPRGEAGLGRAQPVQAPTKPSPVQVRRSPRPQSPRRQTPDNTNVPAAEPAPTAAGQEAREGKPQPSAAQKPSAHRRQRVHRHEEEAQVEREMSGIAKAGKEASVEAAGAGEAAVAPAQEPEVAAPAVEEPAPAAPPTSSGGATRASEEAQTEKQFGAFK